MSIPPDYQLIKTISRGLYGPISLIQSHGKQSVLKSYAVDHKGIPYQCLREINAMRRMNGHPHFIELLDVYMQPDSSIQLIMNDGGETLQSFYEGRNWTLEDRIVYTKKFGRQLLSALQALHAEGYLHRDLKPANLLISNEHLKVCDFGLATKTDPLHPERHSYQIGTLNYRAPELFTANTHNYTQAVDMWSVGCILYKMISGHELFKGITDYRVLSDILSQIPTTEQDLQLLHLDNIRLDKCNTTTYHKTQPLYDPLAMRDIKIRDDLRAIEYVLNRLLVLNPQNRLTATMTLQCGFFASAPLIIPPSIQKYGWFVRPRISLELIKNRDVIIKEFIKTKWHPRTLLAAIDICDMYINAHVAMPPISACLILASKYHDITPLAPVKSTYPADERNLLKAINYQLDRPTLLDLWSHHGRISHILKLSLFALQLCSSYEYLINKSESQLGKAYLK